MCIIVVNGGLRWDAFLPGYDVHHVRIEESRWRLVNQTLIVEVGGQRLIPTGILWRLGAVRPDPKQRVLLEMIRRAGVPCVNNTTTLLQCYDRLSMLNACADAGLPVVPFELYTDTRALARVEPTQLPCVLKVGSHHAGEGKILIEDRQRWGEVVDLLCVHLDYVTVEPFLRYEEDLRYLAVGEQVWVMSRRAYGWRANVDTVSYDFVDPQPQLLSWTQALMTHLEADVLGLDFLKLEDGSYTLLEVNETPGVRGFSEEVRWAIARRLVQKLESRL